MTLPRREARSLAAPVRATRSSPEPYQSGVQKTGTGPQTDPG
jgi:hypothetical protein